MRVYVLDPTVYAAILVGGRSFRQATNFLRSAIKSKNVRTLTLDITFREVCSAIWFNAVVLRRIDSDRALLLATYVGKLIRNSTDEVVPLETMVREAMDTSLRLEIPFNRAAYVALALRTGAELVTCSKSFEEELRRKGLDMVRRLK